MGLVEALLLGIQFKRLEKPFVFLSMLVAFMFFTALGFVIVLAGIETFAEGKGFLAAIGVMAISLLFFGLSAVCGYFIKRCIK